MELPAPGSLLDPRRLFAAPPPDVWLEIGFGAGEHLLAQARRHPDVGFIGCEPYVNGVAALLPAIAEEGSTPSGSSPTTPGCCFRRWPTRAWAGCSSSSPTRGRRPATTNAA